MPIKRYHTGIGEQEEKDKRKFFTTEEQRVKDSKKRIIERECWTCKNAGMATQNAATTTLLEDKMIKYGSLEALLCFDPGAHTVWYDVKPCADGCFGRCSLLNQHRSKKDSPLKGNKLTKRPPLPRRERLLSAAEAAGQKPPPLPPQQSVSLPNRPLLELCERSHLCE